MSLFAEIEKSIERGFRRWTEKMFGPGEADAMVVMQHQILEDVESKVQTMARGKRVFPFTRVTVTLASADAARRDLLESAFGERLPEDIREALTGIGCELPRAFTVEVRTAENGASPFMVEYGKDAPAKPREATAVARLVVVRGKTERGEYTLEKARTNIGRLAELTDSEQRVVRRNDIVFEEGGDEANATVSRRHAHIKLDDGEYRICDDGSEFGTRVFRDGRPIEVPAGNRRGERLRTGDEVYLGRGCLRFER
ncbi:MAG TPA: FHA domain-containing protein [Bryobacteraceae bacterium]